ncbi:methyl-accepting chemotaxis protein [Sphingomonas sp.]|uniref:methyl-accepting chemotaxis protein n=1 Tax=Sphingomonas sp. TaxID=28214 RepID=UPI003B00FFC8
MSPSDRLAELLEKRLRLQDRPLVAKFAAAPVIMLGLFTLATLLSVAALIYARHATSVVEAEMRVATELSSIAARFIHDDDALHRLLVDKATGGPSFDTAGRAAAIKTDLTRLHDDFVTIDRQVPLQDRSQAHAVADQIAQYAEAVDVVSSMLDVNFASSAAMLAPFRANADHAIASVDRMVAQGVRRAQEHAAVAAARTRVLIGLTIMLTAALAVIGLIVPVGIGKATIRSIVALAEATRSLAERRYEVDLDAFARKDELGMLVAALKTFRSQLVEKEMMELDAAEEERRQAIAVDAANERNAREREAMLERLTHEFESKVRRMIGEAGDAMLRVDANAAELERTVANANALASQLEELATMFAAEMRQAGIATGELTCAIRRIDEEAGRSSGIATAILARANSAGEEVSGSERCASEVERVVDVIDEIARQTNLLALNATIEAARSGEAGRGFAVVASEIKALSGRTGESTGVVRHQVRQVQDGVGRIVAETGELSRLIEQMEAIARRMSSTSSEQASSTGRIETQIEAVRSRVDVLSTVSRSIRDAAGGNARSIGELRSGGRRLQDALSALNGDAQSFIALLRAR